MYQSGSSQSSWIVTGGVITVFFERQGEGRRAVPHRLRGERIAIEQSQQVRVPRLVLDLRLFVSRYLVLIDLVDNIGEDIFGDGVIRFHPGQTHRVHNDQRDLSFVRQFTRFQAGVIPDIDRSWITGIEPQMAAIDHIDVRPERFAEIYCPDTRFRQGRQHIIDDSGHHHRFARSRLAEHEHKRRADRATVEEVQPDQSSGRRGA